MTNSILELSRIARSTLVASAAVAAMTLWASAARADLDDCGIEERDLVTGELLVVLHASPDNPRLPVEPLDVVLGRHRTGAGWALDYLHPARPDLDWIPQLLMARLVVTDVGGLGLEAAADEAALDLEGDPAVERAEAHEHVDTPEGGQRAIGDIELTRSWAEVLSQPAAVLTHLPEARALATGFGVIVAVIDGNASLTNPELAGRLQGGGFDFVDGAATADVPPNGVDDDGDTVIDEGAWHATHVAGLIHAVAPEARILHVRVLDDEGRGRAFDLAHGITVAVEAGADVLNLSLGMPNDMRAVEKALEYALARNVAVVAAAGNRNLACLDFPANLQADPPEHPLRDVIAVAAVDDTFVKAPFSSYAAEVDLSAPGVGILSLWGEDMWNTWDGTSFATPLVAGGAALILGRYPTLTPAEVEQALVDTVQPDANPLEYDGLMGAGVLDLAAAAGLVLPVRETLRLTEHLDGTEPSFTEVEGATRHDLLRGDLANLREAGGVIDLGALTCIADDITPAEASAVRDAGRPGAGRTYFYVVRDDAAPDDLGRDSRGCSRVAASTDCAP